MTTGKPTTFGELLASRELSTTAFGRLMAEADGNVSHANVERWRSYAYRWSDGKRMRPDMAAKVARVLGVDLAELDALTMSTGGSVASARELRSEVAELRARINDLEALVSRLAAGKAPRVK